MEKKMETTVYSSIYRDNGKEMETTKCSSILGYI